VRVRWIAKPSVSETQVKEVDFLIDGTLRGIELQAPYNYGSDDFHHHLGWLVTSFLTPGQHKFTAQAKLNDGRTASNTVLATVSRAPAPPAGLAGHWKRNVTDRQIRREQPDAVPSGVWKLVFERAGVWALDPKTSGIAEHAVISRSTLHVDAGLWITPNVDGHTTTNRYGHPDLGANFCREDGPPGTRRRRARRASTGWRRGRCAALVAATASPGTAALAPASPPLARALPPYRHGVHSSGRHPV
jgi:hypothetical protein